MQYLSPYEAEWSMKQNTHKMQQLIEQQQLPLPAKGAGQVRRWWQDVLSALRAPNSVPRKLEPAQDRK